MSADRTLMSAIRTALSLIAFGFAIYQLFTSRRRRGASARLVVVGIVLLALCIFYHVRFISGLRDARTEMMADGLIHGQSAFPRSLVLITAVLLLLIGVAAMISMVYHVGPFD
jgi:putative membrane protein